MHDLVDRVRRCGVDDAPANHLLDYHRDSLVNSPVFENSLGARGGGGPVAGIGPQVLIEKGVSRLVVHHAIRPTTPPPIRRQEYRFERGVVTASFSVVHHDVERRVATLHRPDGTKNEPEGTRAWPAHLER